MALQVGTVDGLINIGPKITDVFVKAIAAFAEQGVEYAKSKGIPFGAAFQRFTYPVYSGESSEFKVTSIDKPVYTKSGKEQSPAFITYCRKMGLLIIDEPKSLFKLTTLGGLLLNNTISLQEYAFVILSKQGVFQNGEYKTPLFAIIAGFLSKFPSITVETLQQYVFSLYNDTEIEKTRFDIILGALSTSGLLVKENNSYYIGGLREAKVIEDIEKNISKISPALLDDNDEYSFYIGESICGIFDILLPSNIALYQELFPNLVEHAKLCHTYLTNKYSQSRRPRQIIFYGAPGTGKSHEVNKVTCAVEKETKENNEAQRVFRTTFHPDSDYSTFVGSYKPSMKPVSKKQAILDYDGLVDKFKEYLAADNNITRACTKFGFDYHDSIVKMQENNAHTIPVLVADAYKSGTTYDTQVRSGMSVYETSYKEVGNSDSIIYSFVPQAFINAYVRAWQTNEPVYLVIEEINRGNCAQIFGDLFQLLDRDENLESKYPITPDSDLQEYLLTHMGNAREDTPIDVKEGKSMKLPSNLYIWATMNTSDQSLFPIDSAFKRRWDWKYMKIVDHKDKDYHIVVNDKNYSWWAFIDKMNKHIGSTTSSEDKQLGYFFVHKENGEITANEFVNKVLFYLYNDALKDYSVGLNVTIDGKKRAAHFSDFYDENGDVVEELVIEALDDYLAPSKETNSEDAQ